MHVITGGTGFIGSHIAETLVRQGARVRVVDDLSTGRIRNLAAVADDIEFVRGDIRDAGLMARALRSADVVFHQAAMASVPGSVEDPHGCLDRNLMGTLSVLTAARDNGVRRVVQASSSAVYGDSPSLPLNPALRPLPKSPYAVSKLAAETLGQAFTASYGLDVVALRYFNVFGPRQDPESPYAAVIPKFIAAVRDGRPVTVHGDGKQSRDFVFVDDVVRANLLAAEAEQAPGGVFDVATGHSVTVEQVLTAVCEALGRQVDVRFAPAGHGQVLHSRADGLLAEQVLGFRPTVTFADGLRRTARSVVAPPPLH